MIIKSILRILLVCLLQAIVPCAGKSQISEPPEIIYQQLKTQKLGTNDYWNTAVKYLEAISYLDSDSALELANKMLEIAENTGIPNFESMVYLQKANAHQMQSDNVTAMGECQIAYAKCHDNICRYKTLLHYGYYLGAHKNEVEAFKVLYYAYERFRELKMHRDAADALSNIGILFVYKSDYVNAGIYFRKALVEAMFDRDLILMSDILYSLAESYYHQNDIENCKNLYLKSLELSELTKNIYGSCLTLQKIASLELEEQRYKEGLMHAKRANLLARQLNNLDETSNSYILQLQISAHIESYDSITKLFETFIAFDDGFSVPLNRCSAYIAYSEFCARNGKLPQAIHLARQAYDYGIESYDINTQIASARNYKDILARQKDIKNYFYVSEKLDSLNDELEWEVKKAKADITKKGLDLYEKAGFEHNNFIQLQAITAKESEMQKLLRNIMFVVLINLIFFLFLGYRIYRQKVKTAKIIFLEKEKSENLLLNILPKPIAEELKSDGKVEAKSIPAVTVMFIDIVGFTKISEKLTPHELVSEIDIMFKKYDSIIDKYGIEKIKTIGDAYMCACGLSGSQGPGADEMVLAALEIRRFMAHRSAEQSKSGKPSFSIRIGIHTGPVVAGVVGSKKFAYDIWGDTVNIASRMESSSEEGKINISEATKNQLKNKSFTFEHRGQIIAKNKGPMEMYFVDLGAT